MCIAVYSNKERSPREKRDYVGKIPKWRTPPHPPPQRHFIAEVLIKSPYQDMPDVTAAKYTIKQLVPL